jgi:phosphatidylethanolamine-binding protein (PEBP) family uncharacterized protein
MSRTGEERPPRRSARRTVVALCAAAIAVAVGIALWSHAATHDGNAASNGRTLSPSSSAAGGRPTPTRHTASPALSLTADQVVDDPSSSVRSLAVSPTDPDVASAVWWHCATKDCNHGAQAALAVTTDNWRTRSTRPLESFTTFSRSHLVVSALSDGRFIVHRVTTYGKPAPADPAIVNPDLTLTPLVEAAGARGSSGTEVMPATVLGGASAWAIDPGAQTFRDVGRGHRWTSAALTANGIIVASNSENRVGYSTDRGATWQFVPDDAPSRRDGRWAVAAAEPGVIAVLEGNRGCEAGCPDTLDLSRDSGVSWSRVYLGGHIGYQGVITARGTLIFVGARPLVRRVQVMRSTADSLGDLQVVLGRGVVRRVDHLALSASSGAETITACGDDGVCARSVDDGRTWSPFAMR